MDLFPGRRSVSVPPQCSRRTDSSRYRVKQYTDRLQNLRKYSGSGSAEEESNAGSTTVPAMRQNYLMRRSPSVSSDIPLAPIPEERLSFIEREESGQRLLDQAKSNVDAIRIRNESLRRHFFRELMEPGADMDPGKSNASMVRVSGQSRSGYLANGHGQGCQQPTYSSLPRPSEDSGSYGSLKRKKQLLSTSLNSLLPEVQQQQPTIPTVVVNPANPLRESSRSRSGSPMMTFTSCVKVEYKPKVPPSPGPPNQPLYGRNQFNPTLEPEPEVPVDNPFRINRSQSANAIHEDGIYFANLINVASDNDIEIPPPRPPLPKNYYPGSSESIFNAGNFNDNDSSTLNNKSGYFLSLPRDCNLTRSASTSLMFNR